MIRFTLRCGQGHEFEGWFRDNAAFDRQAEGGLLACPGCGDVTVGKAIMAPAIARGGAAPPEPVADLPVPAPAAAASGMDADKAFKLAALLRAVRDHVESNFEDVGPRFSEEARKIHYGEVEERGIYGQATRDDVKALIDEGIEIQPLPMLPKLQS